MKPFYEDTYKIPDELKPITDEMHAKAIEDMNKAVIDMMFNMGPIAGDIHHVPVPEPKKTLREKIALYLRHIKFRFGEAIAELGNKIYGGGLLAREHEYED